jgi:HEPN domain-containing protein
VTTAEDVKFRMGLAEGFLAEARQDVSLERWRSAVDNAQLAVENCGKTVLALFGVSPRTHDPAQQVAGLLRTASIPASIRGALEHVLPELLVLGSREHLLTDYGDEATHTLPWDLFTRQSAEEALRAAERAFGLTREVVSSAA